MTRSCLAAAACLLSLWALPTGARASGQSGPPSFQRGSYRVELWGKNQQQNQALKQQLHNVAGVDGRSWASRVGTGAQQFEAPFLGKVQRAMRGQPMASFDKIAIEPRKRGQRAMELKVKEHTLVIRPEVTRSGKVKVLTPDQLEKLWDNGTAIGLTGWKLLFRKGRSARKKWSQFQPISNLRVMLRDEVRSTVKGVMADIKEIKSGAAGRDQLKMTLANHMVREYRSGTGGETLYNKITRDIGSASAADLKVFKDAFKSFLGNKGNQAGMADAVFAVGNRPMAYAKQTQRALVVISQVLNNHKIDVAALLNLAGSRSQFVSYLPGVAGAKDKAKTRTTKTKRGSTSIRQAVVRLIDRIHQPKDRQSQSALVAVSQVLTRDDIRVNASIGVGVGLVTAAADYAHGVMKQAQTKHSSLIIQP